VGWLDAGVQSDSGGCELTSLNHVLAASHGSAVPESHSAQARLGLLQVP